MEHRPPRAHQIFALVPKPRSPFHSLRNRVQFLEIDKPHSIRLTMRRDGEGDKDVGFQSRILFEEAGEGTDLTNEGGKQHLGKLGKHLETLFKESA